MHRLREGAELRRLNELLIVSILGLVVNVVGLTAFGHAHAHGHSHSHSHDHSCSHSHSEQPKHKHAHSNGCLNESHHHPQTLVPHKTAHTSHTPLPPTPISTLSTPHQPAHVHPHSHPPTPHHHHHDHSNENMQGIFLHILADAMGSVAVIVSTLLTQYTGWMGWDPVASVFVA